MPHIADTFNISDGSENRKAIRVINDDIPSIAVSVWSQQGRSNDDDLFQADVIIHGNTASFVLNNFAPGNAIYVAGELVSEMDQGQNGNKYMNNEILADDISFVPSDRSNQAASQSQGRDNYQGQQNQGGYQQQQGGGQPNPNPSPNRGGGTGGGASGHQGPDNTPAPRSR